MRFEKRVREIAEKWRIFFQELIDLGHDADSLFFSISIENSEKEAVHIIVSDLISKRFKQSQTGLLQEIRERLEKNNPHIHIDGGIIKMIGNTIITKSEIGLSYISYVFLDIFSKTEERLRKRILHSTAIREQDKKNLQLFAQELIRERGCLQKDIKISIFIYLQKDLFRVVFIVRKDRRRIKFRLDNFLAEELQLEIKDKIEEICACF